MVLVSGSGDVLFDMKPFQHAGLVIAWAEAASSKNICEVSLTRPCHMDAQSRLLSIKARVMVEKFCKEMGKNVEEVESRIEGI